jgi:hypothetical protein
MSARSWLEARTQGVFVSVRDTDASEDNVLEPRDCAQPVFLCFQPSADSSASFVAGAYGRGRGRRTRAVERGQAVECFVLLAALKA